MFSAASDRLVHLDLGNWGYEGGSEAHTAELFLYPIKDVSKRVRIGPRLRSSCSQGDRKFWVKIEKRARGGGH